MGKSLEQILAEVHDGDTVGVTLVTNQDSGVVGYATGGLLYRARPAGAVLNSRGGVTLHAPTLSSTSSEPLGVYFNDRRLDIDPAAPEGSFGHSPRQPFSANATDRLGMSISIGTGTHVMHLTFLTWGGGVAHLPMEPRGNVLVGIGPPLGDSSNAVYVVSFGGLSRPPH